jgi:hypothetical protein
MVFLCALRGNVEAVGLSDIASIHRVHDRMLCI